MSSKEDIEKSGQKSFGAPENLSTELCGVRAFVIMPHLVKAKTKTTSQYNSASMAGRHNLGQAIQDHLNEAVGLALAIDLDVIQSFAVQVAQPKPATLIGSGKVEEIKEIVKIDKIDLVIIDHALTPIQQRNLEKSWSAKVLDRTGLILEIFGKRAQTKEGRLQVELAHLEYQKSRLVRSWTHLERQRGGFGFLGGPGETQIEADRRQLQDRISAIRRDLEQVKKTRQLHRKGRKKVPYPVVALVGYTNAGKSSIFNVLTAAKVFAKDLLFATLDPTMREVTLPSGTKIILSDTVGFISDLPTQLIAAFRATLEEVLEADIILHVRDISHAQSDAQMQSVNEVLFELGIEPDSVDHNIIYVWNKIDTLNLDERHELEAMAERLDETTSLVSAETGQGIAALCDQIDQIILQDHHVKDVCLPAEQGALSHWLYDNSEVLERTYTDTGEVHFKIRISDDKNGKLEQFLTNIKS
ncbi:MAG: GTPase HflX [Pseudomonadota bacterium]